MNGFCPALLRSIDEIAGGNAPSKKLHIAGFLAAMFCCQNSTVSPVNDGFEGSHERPLTVKYRQRPTLDHVQEEDNCDINRIPAYSEWQLPTLGFVSTSFYLSDAQVQQYCADASIERPVGAPQTSVMREVYDLILEHANLLMRKINLDLVTEMATEFGENVTTGSSTGKVINISRNNEFALDNGIVDIMRDIQENEICGDPCIIGGGLFAAYDMSRAAQCCGAAGVDMSRFGVPRFFFDKDTQSIWGQDTIGLFAPGSVKFIGRNKYTGAFAGQRGSSFFTTLPLPVNEFGCNVDDCLRDLVFDLQLKYVDCPTEYDGPSGPVTVNRGWIAILSKPYALWVQPEDAYASQDELSGTNGTLKYFITNNSGSGGAYAYPS